MHGWDASSKIVDGKNALAADLPPKQQAHTLCLRFDWTMRLQDLCSAFLRSYHVFLMHAYKRHCPDLMP